MRSFWQVVPLFFCEICHIKKRLGQLIGGGVPLALAGVSVSGTERV